MGYTCSHNFGKWNEGPLCEQAPHSSQNRKKINEVNYSHLFFSAEFPFINYFVIHKTRDEAAAVFKEARAATYDAFAPEKTGYTCSHDFGKYDEVATIARPPIEPISRRPTSSNTGYIVCMYRVFRGDDGQKFERNWLYWTGKTILYFS